MANQGRFNSSFWKKLDNLGEIPTQGIVDILNKNIAQVQFDLDALTPQKYGGLVASRYAVVEVKPDKVIGRAGYTQTPHWDLDPADPHQDDITNPKLAEYLADNSKKEFTKAAMARIENSIYYFSEQCRTDIKWYLKEYYKRR